MRLVALEHGPQARAEGEKPIAEMQGDGSIYSTKHGERHFFGRVSNDALLDAHDTPVFTCVHREIGLPGSPMKGHYDATDAYDDGHARIAIQDDGTVTMNGKAGGAKIEGPVAKTRRTAVLLVFAAMSQ